MQHRIKKQIFILLVDPGMDVFSLQQAASSYYWEQILPILERVFDELSTEGETIRLDKLEIDLGSITEASLYKSEMREKIYQLLREKLGEAFSQQDRHRGLFPSRETGGEQALRQWWYYMEHGRLHWGQLLLTEDWYTQVMEILSVDYAAVSRLREAIQKDSEILLRICSQHGDHLLETLLGILVAARQEKLGTYVGSAIRLTDWLGSQYREQVEFFGRRGRQQDARGRASLRQSLHEWYMAHRDHLSLSGPKRKAAIWRVLLLAAVDNVPSFRQGGGVRALADWLLDGDPVLMRLLKKERAALPAELSDFLQSASMSGRKEDTAMAGDDLSGEPRPAASVLRKPHTGEPVQGKAVARSLDEQLADEDGIYVPHAGLILLHPFLSTCFSRLGWWADGRFVSDEAREKAVFLLHYLVTGKEEAPEFELVLPKVLCGCDAETPFPGKMELGEEVYAEAEELLQMVLIRWEKLQGSSVGGLREGFLQRGGKLLRRNGQLVLQVEQQAIDILLDYLPWNLGIVKMPWLGELIYVEWR